MLHDSKNEKPEKGRRLIVHCADGIQRVAWRNDNSATGFTVKAPWNFLSINFVESWEYADEKVFIPKWLEESFFQTDLYFISITELMQIAEKKNGKMSLHQKECLEEYLNDLADGGIIKKEGNLIFKK